MTPPLLEKIISGGQTGADQGGWRAARECGIPTGGAMPRGFLTEDGPRPEFAELYGALELETDEYRARTIRNVQDSDGTMWFGDYHSRGGAATLDACRAHGKPFLIVFGGITKPSEAKAWIEAKRIRVLNAAGNRESAKPGIGERVARFLGAVLEQLERGA